MNLKNKKVVVVGLGRSGVAAARFLRAKGAWVRVTERSAAEEILRNAAALRRLGAAVETGGHTERFLEGSELFVTSPGVPKESLPLRFARKKGIPVISEIELGFRFCSGTIVAVTGSNGKTTTVHLLQAIFRRSGRPSVLCGNVGTPFLDSLPRIGKKTVVVLEASSFQLEASPSFRPKVAVVLNLSPNHLDRHGTFRGYAAAKRKIYRNQKRRDFLILNGRDPVVRRMAARARGAVWFFGAEPARRCFGGGPSRRGFFLKDGWVIQCGSRGVEERLFRREGWTLCGEHNLENILAAAAAARALGVPPRVIAEAARAFRALPHRIEPVGELRGVRFVNDSKSTTPASTRAAILAASGPVVLVAGGRGKGAPFGAIEEALEERVRTAVFYGEAREKIAASWKRFTRFRLVADFKEAVRAAFRAARPGDWLLLSPMCASFDQFRSYEHRGEAFREVFGELKKRNL